MRTISIVPNDATSCNDVPQTPVQQIPQIVQQQQIEPQVEQNVLQQAAQPRVSTQALQQLAQTQAQQTLVQQIPQIFQQQQIEPQVEQHVLQQMAQPRVSTQALQQLAQLQAQQTLVQQIPQIFQQHQIEPQLEQQVSYQSAQSRATQQALQQLVQYQAQQTPIQQQQQQTRQHALYQPAQIPVEPQVYMQPFQQQLLDQEVKHVASHQLNQPSLALQQVAQLQAQLKFLQNSSQQTALPRVWQQLAQPQEYQQNIKQLYQPNYLTQSLGTYQTQMSSPYQVHSLQQPIQQFIQPHTFQQPTNSTIQQREVQQVALQPIVSAQTQAYEQALRQSQQCLPYGVVQQNEIPPHYNQSLLNDLNHQIPAQYVLRNQPNLQSSVNTLQNGQIMYQPLPNPTMDAFNGSNMDIYDFVDKFETTALVSGWLPDRQAQMIQAYLSGEAKALFNNLDYHYKFDIYYIKQFLLQEYALERDVYWKNFNNRLPKLNEKPKTFALAIQTLLNRAMPQLLVDQKEQILKSKLINVLPLSIQQTLKLQGNKSWSETIKNVEAVIDAFGSNEVSQQIVDFNSDIKKTLALGNASSKSNVPFNKNSNQNSYQDDRVCYNCGGVGHMKRECPSQAQSSWNRSQNKPYNNENRSFRRNENEDSKNQTNVNCKTFQIIQTNNELLRIKCKLLLDDKDVTTNALIDTGSTHSFINSQLLPIEMKHQLEKFLQCEQSISNNYGFKVRHFMVQTVNSSIKATGVELVILLKLKSSEVRHRFIITNVINSEEVILGIDFIKSNNISIINGESIEFQDSDQNEVQTFCKITKTQIIPANAEILLEVMLSNVAYVDNVGLFEPFDHSKQGLIVAKSIDTSDSNKIMKIKVMNVTDEPVTLKVGQTMGTVESIELSHRTDNNVQESSKSQLSNKNLDHLNQIEYGKNLNEEQRAAIAQLIEKYEHLFSKNQYDIGQTSITEHKINTLDSVPIKSHPYKTPMHVKKEIRKQVDDMLKHNIIEESESPWSSPVVLVKKKNDTYRFCVDFRKVNKVTCKDAFPLPLMDDALQAFNGAMFLSTLDMSKAYHQVRMCEKDKEKTAFCTYDGLYQFKVMPYGLTNAPGTFQRLMNKILKDFAWNKCLIYLDDVFIYTMTFLEHLEALEGILKKIEAAKLKLQPSKCHFATNKVKFLGHLITDKGILPDPDKCTVISELNPPTNVTEVKSFMGMTSYYRRYVPQLSDIAIPLYDIQRKGIPFHWTTDHQESFDTLKLKLTSAPILIHPNFEEKFYIQCDASNRAIGAVLSQMTMDGDNPVAYASRTLNNAEKNYTVTERELLAAVWAAKYFRQYIHGRGATVYTDHKPLAELQSLHEPQGRLAKLILKLQNLGCDIAYRKGCLNGNADFLSRININRIELENPINWYVEQQNDNECKLVKQFLEKEIENADDQNQKLINIEQFVPYLQYLSINSDGIILHSDVKILVPEHMRMSILKEYHDQPMAGHMGINKTKSKIVERFFWPKMGKEIRNYVLGCNTCQKHKNTTKIANAPLQSIVSSFPFEIINIDVVGPLPTTENGNRYIIVAVDLFSKWMECAAVPSFSAVITAKFILNRIVGRFGYPKRIQTDQGTNFESILIQELCQLLKIEKSRSTAYHPETNGQVERQNRTLKQLLSCFVNETFDDWDEWLTQLSFAYNTTIHSSTQVSPFEIIYGRKPLLLHDLTKDIKKNEKNEIEYVNEYIRKLKEKNEKILKLVKRNLSVAQTTQKYHHDKHGQHKYSYAIGSLVLLINIDYQTGKVGKLAEKFSGPFRVKRILNLVNYEIETPEHELCQIVHYNRLKPYHEQKLIGVAEQIEKTDRNIMVSDLDNQVSTTRVGRISRPPIRYGQM